MDDLLRVNFFDGRLLTADAMRQDQGYWDGRARLLAQARGAGVCSGLELAFGHTLAGVPTGPVTIQPGLGFTTTGAPVLVSEPITFGWMDLTRGPEQKATSTKAQPVVRFSGSLPPAPTAPPSVEPVGAGLYLLWLAPVELAEREGRVVDPAVVDGVVDAWRGGVRVELRAMDMPTPSGDTAWAKRSCAAWNALTTYSSEELGPDGIAIALVSVNASGGVDWVEPALAVRAGELGRGARLNRQFQRQRSDMAAAGVDPKVPLKKLGFYAIPPFGVLPGLSTLQDAKANFADANVVLGGVSSLDDRGWQAAERASQGAMGWVLGEGLETLEASQQKTDLTSAPELAPFWAEAAKVGVGVGSIARRAATLVRVFVPSSGKGPLRFAIETVATALEAWEVQVPEAAPLRAEGPLLAEQVPAGALRDALAIYLHTPPETAPALATLSNGNWTPASPAESQVAGWVLRGGLAALGARSISDLLDTGIGPAAAGITISDVCRSGAWVDWVAGVGLCGTLETALIGADLSADACAVTSQIRDVEANRDRALGRLVLALLDDVDKVPDHDATCKRHLGQVPEITGLAALLSMSELTLIGRIAELIPYPDATVVTRLERALSWEDVKRHGFSTQVAPLAPFEQGASATNAVSAVRAWRESPSSRTLSAAVGPVRAWLFSGALTSLGDRRVNDIAGSTWSGATLASDVRVKDAFFNAAWLATLGLVDADVRARLASALAAQAGLVNTPSFADAGASLVLESIKGTVRRDSAPTSAPRLQQVLGLTVANQVLERAREIGAPAISSATLVATPLIVEGARDAFIAARTPS